MDRRPVRAEHSATIRAPVASSSSWPLRAGEPSTTPGEPDVRDAQTVAGGRHQAHAHKKHIHIHAHAHAPLASLWDPGSSQGGARREAPAARPTRKQPFPRRCRHAGSTRRKGSAGRGPTATPAQGTRTFFFCCRLLPAWDPRRLTRASQIKKKKGTRPRRLFSTRSLPRRDTTTASTRRRGGGACVCRCGQVRDRRRTPVAS